MIRALLAEGWFLARIKGSHRHFQHPARPGTVTVPHPRREIPAGTLRAIERQSGVDLRGRG
ncbi:MAG TPA: type II toxin-antitoxin system HicA family toxin [Anaeromyxobacteraceae bacterium]|nr:type II toxin-antitoxin system HicA family toxin [Anaeromyxobacteraceae bacterium]